jgi:hypothetical protein
MVELPVPKIKGPVNSRAFESKQIKDFVESTFIKILLMRPIIGRASHNITE